MDRRENCQPIIALKVAKQQGVKLEPYQDFTDGVAVIGFGAGITMAFADHLRKCYLGIPLLVSDMPGSLSLEQRCLAIDYIACEFPTALLAWNGLRSGADYPKFLKERRDFSSRWLWVYTQGEDNDNARSAWLACGARLLDSLWQDAPLGNLTPRQIEYPWELLTQGIQPG